MRLLIVDPAPPVRDWILDQLVAAGHHLTGVTPVVGGSGLAKCHTQVICDFHPLDQLLERLRREPSFDGVICFHQAAIRFGNQVAHGLGLTPMWADRALDLSNKRVLQELWERAALPVPARVSLEQDFTERVVVKPAGLQGQIGVKVCEGAEAARRWAQHIESITVPFEILGKHYEMTEIYQTDRAALVQELVRADAGTPHECTAEFFVADGEPTYLGGFDKTSVQDAEFPSEELFLFPGVFPRSVETIEQLTRYIRSTGYRNGFCHLEYKIVRGRPCPIELNARLIGTPADQLMQKAMGLDLPSMLVAAATGRGRDVCLPKAQRFAGMLQVYLPREFSNRRVIGFDFEMLDGVNYSSEFYLGDGEEAVLWDSCIGDMIGMIYFDTVDADKAQAIYRDLGRSVRYRFA